MESLSAIPCEYGRSNGMLSRYSRQPSYPANPRYPVRCGLSALIVLLWNTGSPARRVMTVSYTAGTGSAVTDLIFSIAKREVTFFSGTALISFL